MKYVFYTFSAIFWLLCIAAMLVSKSAIHEILYVLFGIGAILSMGFGTIVDRLGSITAAAPKLRPTKPAEQPATEPEIDKSKWVS